MRGWTGMAIAFAGAVFILGTDPDWLFGSTSFTTKIGFIVALLWAAGVIFIVRQLDTHNTFLGRQIVFWSLSFVMIAAGAANINILTNLGKSQVSVANVASVPAPVVVPTKKHRKRIVQKSDVADTSKFNRVEHVVEASGYDNSPIVQNMITKKDTQLPQNWKVTEKQKRQFKQFLAHNGQHYNPETAYALPVSRSKNDPFSNIVTSQ